MSYDSEEEVRPLIGFKIKFRENKPRRIKSKLLKLKGIQHENYCTQFPKYNVLLLREIFM